MQYPVAFGRCTIAILICSPGRHHHIIGCNRILFGTFIRRMGIGNRNPQRERLIAKLLQKSHSLPRHQPGRIILQRKITGPVRKLRANIGQVSANHMRGINRLNWTKPIHPLCRGISGQSPMSNLTPHIEQIEIALFLKTMIFPNQTTPISRRFPQLKCMRGIPRHQRLVSPPTMRMWKLRGPKRNAARHTKGMRRNRVFEQHALIRHTL